MQISQSASMFRAKFSSVSAEVFVLYVKATSFLFPSEEDKRVYYRIYEKPFWNSYTYLPPVFNSDCCCHWWKGLIKKEVVVKSAQYTQKNAGELEKLFIFFWPIKLWNYSRFFLEKKPKCHFSISFPPSTLTVLETDRWRQKVHIHMITKVKGHAWKAARNKPFL